SAAIDAAWLAGVVEVVRRTRNHPDVRIGSSVRGAIDCAAVAASLASLRGAPAEDAAVGLDAALVALSGRLRLREGCTRSAEEIVTELWHEVFAAPAAAGEGEGGAGKASAPTGANRG
ncbi:MAG TPA: ATPase, partial [Acidimicrobiaceae bacterium]|nr:ATPase [Acidimicrobiaceae bacterium]